MSIRYGSICSGIEAASAAWEPLGWSPAWFSEIEEFPKAVLSVRHPEVTDLGDMRGLEHLVRSGSVEAPDILVGGTPCVSFSLAGARGSLSDNRGALALTYVRLANALDDVRLVRGLRGVVTVWENVPGVFSTKDNAFGCFLGALSGEDVPLEPSGRKWTNAGFVLGPKRAIAWRRLDAQHAGLAQRRKRVFVISGPREWFRAEKVLFEFEGRRRDTPPGKEKGEGPSSAPKGSFGEFGRVTGPIVTRPGGCGGIGDGLVVEGTSYGCDLSQRAEGTGFAKEVSPCISPGNHPGHGSYAVTVKPTTEHQAEVSVRRFTPVECERLQGFPDNYTRISWRGRPAEKCYDTPRYKALGNSMAVPVMAWIGKRIDNFLKQGGEK
jgi:DNA (cytosine-5)-methyltransferase 1